PGTWLSRPRITIFTPGYGYFPLYFITTPSFPMNSDDAVLKTMERSGVVFELPPLATREDRLKVVRTVNPLVIPERRMPQFIRLLNQERMNLHLPPIYGGR